MKKTSKKTSISGLSSFSQIKKGEFFRFKGGKKVYRFDGGGKIRGYKYTDTDDINNFKTTKTDRIIEIGFTF